MIKKSLPCVFIAILLLISACEDKTSNSKPIIEKTQPLQHTDLQVKTVSLFHKGIAPVEEVDDPETMHNPDEPIHVSLKLVETNQPWLNNLLLLESAQFFIDSEEQVLSVADEKLKERIHSILERQYKESVINLREMLDEMKQYDIEQGINPTEWKPPFSMMWQHFTLENQLIEQQKNIASFSFFYDSYSGGAHGWHNFVVRNIDLNRKAFIEVDDLIELKNRATLTELLWQRYKKEFEEMEYLTKEDFTISNSFQFFKTGIAFNYPPYAIAPYSAGVVELFIEWGAIQPLLSETYKDLPKYNFQAFEQLSSEDQN